MATPFFKWVGGKTKLLPTLREYLPKDGGNLDIYAEPFLGGGAFLLDIAEERRAISIVGGDINKDLLSLWQVVSSRDGAQFELFQGFVTAIEAEYNADPEKVYYEYRAKELQASSDQVAMAARFLFLNRTGFNGLWRVNKKGKLNTPWGKRDKCPDLMKGVRGAREILTYPRVTGVLEFIEAGFDNLCGGEDLGYYDRARVKLVYFDPPYIPLNPTSNFTGYTSEGFGESQQKALSALGHTLAAQGWKVLISNSDTELSRKIFEGYEYRQVEMSRSINSKGDSRGKITEALFTLNGDAW